MLFGSKNEFIASLKDYYKNQEIAEESAQKYRDTYYLRYEKVKSPLDYEIVGYKNNTPVRQIKGRGVFNEQTVHELQEYLDNQLEYYLDRYTRYKKKCQNTDDELKNIAEPLKSIIILRFRENKRLKDIGKRYNMSESGLTKMINRGLDEYYEEIY